MILVTPTLTLTCCDVFQELSGGKRTVSLTTVAEWDLVAELMEEGMLTKDDLEEFFLQAGECYNNRNLNDK